MKRKRRQGKTARICRLEALESRRLLTVGFDPAPAFVAEAIEAGERHPLSELPALSSNPSAAAKLFLDFGGSPTRTWGEFNAGPTPAYDQDGDPESFCDAELSAIQSIWARLAESFSPFDLDVTTIDTGNRDDLQTLAVAVGGNGDWTGGGYSGAAYQDGFYNADPNAAFVFSWNLAHGDPAFTAVAIAHEAGHGFGLQHQSVYDAADVRLQEYNPGDGDPATVMGSSYMSARSLWWSGPNSDGADIPQDDLALLTDGRNGWGYRADDHAGELSGAERLSVSGRSISGSGLIETVGDRDVFAFSTGAGPVTLAAQPASEGAMLDLQLELYTVAGSLVSRADTGSLGETLTVTVAAGDYLLAVSSHGSVGDVGQYTISGASVPKWTASDPLMDVSLDPVPPTLTPAPFVPGASFPLSSLPQLSSYPSASAKLFLDFDGAPAETWGYYNTTATPPYDQDDDPATFSDGELASIQNIWAQVAETFSPFNVNVTTIDPGNRNDLQTAVVVIGGDGAWSGGAFAGLAHLGGFYNTAPNDAYVFSDNLFDNATYTARCAAHESGHLFGLDHQSLYDAQGNLVNEYNMGDSLKAPIMGSAYSSIRGIWHNGPTPFGATSYQDDLAIMTDGRNGWGYRPDDRGNTWQTGTPLTVNGYLLSGSGVIGQLPDQDVFLLSTAGADLNLAVGPMANGPMLDLQLALYDNANQVIASASTSSLSETISATLPAGNYYVVVASQGQYGDLGQYTISGTLLPPGALAAPTNLTATAASTTVVNLAWQDNSNGEEGFRIERSDNGGSSWFPLALAFTGTAYQDIGLTPGATHQYRVCAVLSSTASDYSNVAGVTMLPAAPSNLSATVASSTVVNLVWLDNSSFEDGFKVQRSADSGSTWTTLTATIVGTTFQDTGRTAGATYQYRVYAVAGSTVSAYSNVAGVAMVPQAPSNLTATAASATVVNLAWQDNCTWDGGFKVQQSTNGGTTWTTLTSSAITATTYQKTSLTAGTTYTYRVFAVSGTTSSAYSNVAQVTTLPAAPSSPRLTVMSFSQIKVTWSNVAGETGFRIERSPTGTSGWVPVGTVPADTLLFYSNGLAPATKYYHRVFAVNESGTSASSSVVSTTTSAAPICAAPSNPAATTALSANQIRVTWSDVAGEASYRIERSANGSSGWAQAGTVALDTLEFTDAGVAAATKYYYRVLAVNSAGTSPASSTVSAMTNMSSPVLTVVSSHAIRVSWSEAAGATSYGIERSLTGAGGWTTAGTAPAGTLLFDDTGLTQQTTYYYRLFAVTAAGTSPPSAVVSAATPQTPSAIPAAPGNPQLLVISHNEIRISWSNVAQESSYRIERSADGTSGWTQVGTVPAETLTYNDTGLTPQMTYYYRVLAVNELGASGASAVVSATTPLPPPVAPANPAVAIVTSHELRVTWSDVAYESSYRVERSANGTSGWTAVGTVPADTLTLNNTGLTQSTKYYYRVIAVNSTGESPASAVVNATTPATPTAVPSAPSSPAVTVLSSSSIKVTWRDTTNELYYRVERSLTGTSGWTQAGTAATNTLLFTDTGLTASTKYYYRVFAVNELGSSVASSVVSGTTQAPPPAAPSNLRTTTIGRTSVTLAWDDNATNESGFKVERSTNGTTWTQLGTTSANVTTYTYTKLSANQINYFRVRAYSSVSNSDYTSVLTITTLP